MHADSNQRPVLREDGTTIATRPWSTNIRSWAVGLSATLMVLAGVVAAWQLGKPWPALIVAGFCMGAGLFVLWRAMAGECCNDSWLRKLF